MRSPLFFFIFFISNVYSSSEQQWKNLLHVYNNKVLIANNAFLKTYQKNKKFNLKEEINFWQKAFSSKSDEYYNLKCVFPARYVQVNGDDSNVESECPLLQTFMKDFDVQKVFIVFSSYYPQNSASLFGHSFLRFQRKNSKGQELIDWGISYSAKTENINPFLMIYKSFFSTFEGHLQLMPYYYKVREYNDFEFRPLWSYELNLNERQIRKLLYHIWELSKVPLDYQYLSHNCSSLVIDAISAVTDLPSLRQEMAFYHIPIDTVKSLKKRGLIVGNPSYRSSLMQDWNQRYRSLNKEEKKIFNYFIDNFDISKLTTTPLMDAAIDYLDFKFGKKLLSSDGENLDIKKLKNDLLFKRSKSNDLSTKLEENNEVSPDQVHEIRKVSIGLSSNNKTEDKLHFKYRYAYHDITDSPEGITSRMKINFIQPELTYTFEHHNVRLESLDVLDLASWSESPEKSYALSYEIFLGWGRWFEYDKNLSGYTGQTSFGHTFDLFQRCFMSILLTEILNYTSERVDELSFKTGPTAQLIYENNFWGFLIRVGHYREITGYQTHNKNWDDILMQARYQLTKVTNIVLQFQHREFVNMGTLNWQYYF